MRPSPRLRLSILVVFAFALAACPPGKTTTDGGVNHPAPQITKIDPNSGETGGQRNVRISGKNFYGPVKVYFGIYQAATVSVVSDLALNVVTAASSAPGVVDVKIVNADGKTVTASGAFTYSLPVVRPKAVNNCVTHWPTSAYVAPGDPPTVAYGWVYAQDVTNFAKQGADISGQIGAGPAADDPSAASWTWTDATYNTDVDGNQGDEYLANVPAPTSNGSYHYAFRFKYANDPWSYCDTDGTNFTGEKAATLTVGPPKAPVVDMCRLQWPNATSTISLTANMGSIAKYSDTSGASNVYGRVVKDGTTGKHDGTRPPDITAQLGFGPKGSAPNSWDTWFSAVYNPDCGLCGGSSEDEYSQSIYAGKAGDFQYAYRFEYRDGGFSYCDSNGIINGGSTTGAMGTLTISAGSAPSVTCALTNTTFTATALGAATPSSIDTAKVLAITGLDAGSAYVIVQTGYGPAGSSTPDASWSWFTGTWAGSVDAQNDQYGVTILAPDTAGTRTVKARAKLSNGDWVACSGEGTLTVTGGGGGSIADGGCTVSSITPPAPTSGLPLTAVAAVKVIGRTDSAGQDTTLKVQGGIGNAGEASTGASWTWTAANYVSEGTGGADTYNVSFRPAITGPRAVSFRYSTDTGTSWSACATAKSVTVATFDQADAGIGYCNLQWPPTLSASGTLTFGQLYSPVFPMTADNQALVVAEFGYGKPALDPGVTGAWTWLPGAANGIASSNNPEWKANFPTVAAGTYGYAWRYHLDGGVGAYCYGDLDGDAGLPFTAGQFGAATIPSTLDTSDGRQ